MVHTNMKQKFVQSVVLVFRIFYFEQEKMTEFVNVPRTGNIILACLKRFDIYFLLTVSVACDPFFGSVVLIKQLARGDPSKADNPGKLSKLQEWGSISCKVLAPHMNRGQLSCHIH